MQVPELLVPSGAVPGKQHQERGAWGQRTAILRLDGLLGVAHEWLLHRGGCVVCAGPRRGLPSGQLWLLHARLGAGCEGGEPGRKLRVVRREARRLVALGLLPA